jgi:predicted TIM-barrel fold metal-dependent hydrolase
MKRRMTLLAAVLLSSCAHPQPQHEAAFGVAARTEIVPIVDAHQHMMSAAAMALTTPAAPPAAIELPNDLANLLRAREAFSGDNYADLFTADAIVFTEEQGRWRTGEERIVDAIVHFPTELRFVPHGYAADGSAGYIAGSLQTASGERTHDFVVGLAKGRDGRWRIASEMKQRILPPIYAPVVDADRVIEVLDDAGIRYGVVLSLGYWFGRPGRDLADPEAATREENDWTIAQTARYPDRLIPFCSVNPIDDYAIAELERCAAIPSVRGMKIHMRNSRVNLNNPDHLERMRQFFRAANRNNLAIVIHLSDPVGPLIEHLLPEAPDVVIQIAHMASGWENASAFADAIEAGRPGTRNLYFDWTQALPIEGLWAYGPSENISGSVTDEEKADVVAIMRRLRLGHILYGNDMPLAWNPTPREWWRRTILTLPLTDDEIRDIADNVPPYIAR